MRLFLLLGIVYSAIGTAAAALEPIETDVQPVDGKSVIKYKTTPEGDLKVSLYFPLAWTVSDRRPIIVFFFAGSCATGSPEQFAATAKYFSARGLVAAVPEYRIETVHGTPPERCMEDGKSAIRWARKNAGRLGIDSGRVIAAGGSSGGTIAAFAAYNSTFEADDEDRSISAKPNALVLLNPAFHCPGQSGAEGTAPCAMLSSWDVTEGGPPAILFYGTQDPLADGGREFARELIRVGIRAEFYTAAGERHGFFNRFPDSLWHALVLREIDRFLVSLGYLKGDPEVEIPRNATTALDKATLVSSSR